MFERLSRSDDTDATWQKKLKHVPYVSPACTNDVKYASMYCCWFAHLHYLSSHNAPGFRSHDLIRLKQSRC